MTNYNFSTLNDKEFEDLVRDLLNKELCLSLKSFPSGRDKGIDLRRWTKTNPNEVVVQVKHYVESSYATLKNNLLKKEKFKVEKLKPLRYIFVTSRRLSISQRDEIRNIFSPYILDDNDVYSQTDLNALLLKFPDIEKKYYKLWLSSTSILQNIFNNAVESRTKYFLERLTKRMKYLVPTKNIDDANRILKDEKILLITGQPGIGKSTLAEILIFNFAKLNFKIHKVEDIIEAESVISDDPKEKQLFYFDDFLGSNYTEIIDSHKTETRLTSFVDRIYNIKNKYIILTTRTVILNQANLKYEKINRSKINVDKFELKLEDYSNYDKALILYNHLYFNKTSEALMSVILEKKYYFDIIKHKNYSPRIIEFLTESSKVKKLSPQDYFHFIKTNLENPSEIWSHSFNNQIDSLDRSLLLTLFTLNSNVEEEVLFKSFEKRLELERVHYNQVINSDQFNSSIKKLLNGFLSKSIMIKSSEKRIDTYSFINPSLGDFLINYVSQSISEKKNIINSVMFSVQLSKFNPLYNNLELNEELQLSLKSIIIKNQLKDIEGNDNNSIAKKINYLYKYCNLINTDKHIIEFIQKIDFKESWSYIVYSCIDSVLQDVNFEKSERLFNYCKENFFLFFEKILESKDSEYYSYEIEELFEKYEKDFNEYSMSEKGKNSINDFFGNLLNSFYEDKLSLEGDNYYDFDCVEKMYHELVLHKDYLCSELGLLYDIENKILEIDYEFWENKIEENNQKLVLDSNVENNYDFKKIERQNLNVKNENKKIENLFS